MTSQIKTVLLLGLLTALLLLLGQALGGSGGLVLALTLALVLSGIGYWRSDRIVLALYQARELSPAEAPKVHELVSELAASAGLPKPRLARIEQDCPNAFATGRDPQHAVIAVTAGLLRLLPPEELRGVLAHELGHIQNRDILLQSVAAVLAAAILSVAQLFQWGAFFGLNRRDNEEGGSGVLGALALAILAPLAATLLQLALSRSREFLADTAGARLSRRPLNLANALERLETSVRQTPLQGNPVAATLFVVHPFAGDGPGDLFRTHPSTQERVARLRNLARFGA